MINLKIWNKENNHFAVEIKGFWNKRFYKTENLWHRGHQVNSFIQFFLIIKVYTYKIFVYFNYAKWVERIICMILSLWYFFHFYNRFGYFILSLCLKCKLPFWIDVTCQIWSRFDSLFLKLWNLFQSLRIPDDVQLSKQCRSWFIYVLCKEINERIFSKFTIQQREWA